MRGRRLTALLIGLAALLPGSPAYSQGSDGVYWHIDPGVKTCSMVIDPALTQGEWHTFVQQTGAIVNARPGTSAEPLGARNFTLGLDYSITPVDQHDPAWINTFTHPDAGCPLGDQIKMPVLRATLGVTNTVDIGAFWNTAPQANYGLAGGAFKYAFLKESARVPAAAVSTSITWLTGVPDFNFTVYSVGLVASKRVAAFTPYLGVKESLASGTVTTTKVNLARENVAITQGFVGATYRIWMLGLTAEFDVAPVNTFAVQLGFHPGTKS